MSQPVGRHNREDGPRPGRRLAVLAVAGAAWLATMGTILRSEVLSPRDSPDVRALVESARLSRRHATASYEVRAGEAVLGRLTSSVSGSPEESQLAYVVSGELHAPMPARLKAVVLATWERRPERLIADLDLGGLGHRVDGALASDGTTFRVRYRAPGAPAGGMLEWELPGVPPLAPGPLPIPQWDATAFEEGRAGSTDAPGLGAVSWRIESSRNVMLAVAGRTRSARRSEIVAGTFTVVAFTDEGGQPLRLEIPGGIVVELVEDARR